jgi:hypothetical protein
MSKVCGLRSSLYPFWSAVLGSIRLKAGLNLKGIYLREIRSGSSASGVPYRTFVDWHTIGSKFIAIACGGSIYSLVLIASLGLRVSIAYAAYLVGTTHLHLADMLRSPPEGELNIVWCTIGSPQRSDRWCWRTIISKLICTTMLKWQCLGGMCFTCTCLRQERSSYAKVQSSRVSGSTSSL